MQVAHEVLLVAARLAVHEREGVQPLQREEPCHQPSHSTRQRRGVLVQAQRTPRSRGEGLPQPGNQSTELLALKLQLRVRANGDRAGGEHRAHGGEGELIHEPLRRIVAAGESTLDGVKNR